MTIKKETPEFDITDRDFNIKAWYVQDDEQYKGDALVKITKDGQPLREFLYPAYKIWNLAAHFEDIVDSELENNIDGYFIAGSTGMGGYILPTKAS